MAATKPQKRSIIRPMAIQLAPPPLPLCHPLYITWSSSFAVVLLGRAERPRFRPGRHVGGPKRRCKTSDAGQAPTVTNSHWFDADEGGEEQEPGADGGGEQRAEQSHGAGEGEQ